MYAVLPRISPAGFALASLAHGVRYFFLGGVMVQARAEYKSRLRSCKCSRRIFKGLSIPGVITASRARPTSTGTHNIKELAVLPW